MAQSIAWGNSFGGAWGLSFGRNVVAINPSFGYWENRGGRKKKVKEEKREQINYDEETAIFLLLDA
jgi:hypothetical protein